MPGTGLYNVKAIPAHNDDTQSGAPAGQVITLTVGGLGVTGWEGGYVINTNAAETRAIVSHTNMTVTLEGNLANWLNGHDLDIYDAWATVQGANDQLFVDQALVDFAADQVIQIYDGTYTEDVLFNAGLSSQPNCRLVVRAASGESGVIVTNNGLAGDVFDFAGIPFTTVSEIEVRSEVAAEAGIARGGYGGIVENCLIDGIAAGTQFGLFPSRDVLIRGTTIQNCCYGVRHHGGTATAECCLFKNNTSHVWVSLNLLVRLRLCEFAGGGNAVYFTTVESAQTPEIIANQCVFYDLARFLSDVGASDAVRKIRLYVRNCIFHTIATALVRGSYAGILDVDKNCYFGIAQYADNWAGGAVATFAAWRAIADDDGNSPDANSQEANPLFTNPAAGDFTLQATSPCKWAGMGSGVKKDIAGVAFDPYSPDQGVHSSGLHIKVVQPRW